MCTQIDTCCWHVFFLLPQLNLPSSSHLSLSAFLFCLPPAPTPSPGPYRLSSPPAQSGRRMVDLAGGIPGRVIWLWCNVNHIARDFQPAGAESVRPQHLKTPTLAEVTTPEPAVCCWTEYTLINSSAIKFRLYKTFGHFITESALKSKWLVFFTKFSQTALEERVSSSIQNKRLHFDCVF